MIVVDTNIVVALMVSHPNNAAASALYAADADWHMPDWWQIEFSNVLRNYHRSGQLEQPAAVRIMKRAGASFPPANTHPVDLLATLAIACEENITAYDARFIALARTCGKKLVTEDTRLRVACPADTLSLEEALASFA